MRVLAAMGVLALAAGAAGAAAATPDVAERLRTASGVPQRSLPLGSGASSKVLKESGPESAAQGGEETVPFDKLDLDQDGTITRSEWEKYYADHPQKDEITVGGGDGASTSGTVGGKGSDGAAGVRVQATVEKYSQGGSGFMPALVNSFSMIIVTEIGDKTFFIAAILAMSHPRVAVFAGAIGALIVMTLLSVVIGFALPALIPRSLTHFASALLFLYFGGKLLVEARSMDASGPSDELKEVEEELEGKGEGEASAAVDVEHGAAAGEAKAKGDASKGHRHLPLWMSKLVDAFGGEQWVVVLLQALVMTFVGEWGDRSQIATIALAAAKDPYGVALGGILGHTLCTGIAVVGGRLLAARISERVVALAGGVLFVFFGIHSLLFSS
jgi:Ca2+/H+ antiporter, TMEM165/GDT1 family